MEIRMEELFLRINFPSFPLRMGWRMELIYRERGGAMEAGSGGERRKKERGRRGGRSGRPVLN